MRIYISADMEGVSGVVHGGQTAPGAREYDRACALMIGEVNAAIAGAYDGGATAVLVNDSHWNMRNLHLEALDSRAELLSGSPKPLSMVQGLDASFDAVFFVGYHARAGSFAASIDHTCTGSVYWAAVNGREMGELGLNALFAGLHGVPIALVSGDQQLIAEARDLLGEESVTVQVKEAIGRSAARCLPIAEARRRIQEGAKLALERRRTNTGGSWLLRPPSPATLTVAFMNTAQAELAALVPGSERIEARSVQFTHADYREVYRAWRAMYLLAGAA
ncbi:MAG: M55 family metallopeptidase [Chloroflexales bacterium]|nr:M55 family metallopeptidase [Chloroflexales bacterium]